LELQLSIVDAYDCLPYKSRQEEQVLSTKLERLEARLTADQKALLQRAADLEGTSLTDFVIRSAQRAAETAIQTHESIFLTARESRAFVEALLNPPAPNAALRAAARDYRQPSESQPTV
jgi:uncharacterized protein (DUF1778 family)